MGTCGPLNSRSTTLFVVLTLIILADGAPFGPWATLAGDFHRTAALPAGWSENNIPSPGWKLSSTIPDSYIMNDGDSVVLHPFQNQLVQRVDLGFPYSENDGVAVVSAVNGSMLFQSFQLPQGSPAHYDCDYEGVTLRLGCSVSATPTTQASQPASQQ